VPQPKGPRPSKYPLLNDVRWLHEQYVENCRTLEEIVGLLDEPAITRTTVRRALIRNGIPVRSVHDGKLGRTHKGAPRSEETREKIRQKALGREVSQEAREKIRIASTGRLHSEETKVLISLMRRGEGNPMYGTISPNRGPDYTPDEAEAQRRRVRKYRFGITNGEYDDMVLAQDNTCACCRNPETKTFKRDGRIAHLAVDHDHKTGRVRELLCNRCNVVLGFVDDDISLLQAMIDYLIKWRDIQAAERELRTTETTEEGSC